MVKNVNVQYFLRKKKQEENNGNQNLVKVKLN